MSTETEISRIRTARDKIRTKFIDFGLATQTSNLTELSLLAAGMQNNGAVSAKVKEGDTYTIPKGYHNGSGTVSGIAGGGSYNLQSKIATPSKEQQSITPDLGYYGLSDVTIKPIPESYQDVTSVTATAGDVLANKIIVDKTGKQIAGNIPINGNISETLNAKKTSFTIPIGYHSGKGVVNIVTEEKTVTPTKELQNVSPTVGSVLKSVTVNPIPAEFIDTSGATAVAEHLLAGDTAFVNGSKIVGLMPNNGDTSGTVDGLNVLSVDIPAGYTTGGKISLTDDIEKALAEI